MELLNNLGINGKLLVAQIINFLILLFVLYKFAYGPILKMLEERTNKIEKGLKDADESHKKLGEIMQKEKEVLAKARQEAQAIIVKAEEQARKSKDEIAVEAKTQAEKIMKDTEKKIEEEKNKMLAEVKSEVANLVISATERIISEKVDENKDRELIERSLKD